MRYSTVLWTVGQVYRRQIRQVHAKRNVQTRGHRAKCKFHKKPNEYNRWQTLLWTRPIHDVRHMLYSGHIMNGMCYN